MTIVNKNIMQAGIDELNYWIEKSYEPADDYKRDVILRCLRRYGSELIELTESVINHEAKELLHEAECLIDTSATTIGRLVRNEYNK